MVTIANEVPIENDTLFKNTGIVSPLINSGDAVLVVYYLQFEKNYKQWAESFMIGIKTRLRISGNFIEKIK